MDFRLKARQSKLAKHELDVTRMTVGKRHTFLSGIILFVMVFLIGYSGYSVVWSGDHFDDMEETFELENNQWMIETSHAFGLQHPLEAYHQSCGTNQHVHSSNPKHHSNVETLLIEMDHKHHYYLSFALHVQPAVAVTSFLKLFFLIDMAWPRILEIMIVLTLISTFLQFIGLVSFFVVLFHVPAVSSILLIIGQFWLAIIELGSFLAMWSIRQKLHFLKRMFFESQTDIMSHRSHIEKNSDNELLKRASQTVFASKENLKEFIIHLLFKSKDNLSRLSLNPNKQKFD